LIVDDHELIRMGIRATLAEIPHCEICGEAFDGKEAVEKTLQLKPDLVIMDIILPAMSGIEATRQIRKTSSSVKILIISVHDAPSISSLAKLVGADGFLTKGLAATELQEAIAELLAAPNSSHPA
jgi:DNA-binding NarL/FixJ family response regulator